MGYRNGLYYESMDIRNAVLLRNIGKYRGYKHSFLENGGLAVGMPYAFETELHPFPLSERSSDGLHLGVLFNKEENPKIGMAFREGGLFGYTHEVINPYNDWLYRNENLMRSYYDYPSTEDVRDRLDEFPSALPWGQGLNTFGGTISGGLRIYSSHNEPQNSEYFDDYRDYVRAVFTDGTSLDKSLGEGYGTRILYNGFDPENVTQNVTDFIENKSGYMTDDVDFLKSIEDTKLGYVGRVILGEQKGKQINNVERPEKNIGITTPLGLYYGMSTSSLPNLKQDRVGSAGVSYDFDIADSLFGDDRKFIVELKEGYDDEILDNEETYEDESYGGYSLSNPQMRYLRDIHERALRTQSFYKNGINERYIEYSNRNENSGYSIEGAFGENGLVGTTLVPTEHYDEQDTINDGERDILSAKISYSEVEHIGIDDSEYFSSNTSRLLNKTKKLFSEHKIRTLVGRFHTSGDDGDSRNTNLTQSATDPTYGISHGRNLLKLNKTFENGYENPYCRVWTYHHQYSKMTDLIRPFVFDGKFASVDRLQKDYPGRPILLDSGRGSWADKTVLNKNGFVNIAPTKMSGMAENDIVRAKQCMFSIENLAWKGVNKDPSIIDTGEIGPLGGRIMWFPPYNLQFNESVSVNWGGNDFIGRGERIYSYNNTDRTGTLSFTILADHPSILNYWRREKYGDGPGDKEGDQTVLRFFAGCDTIGAPKATLDGIGDVKETEYNLSRTETHTNNPEKENENLTPTPNENIEEEIVPGPPEEFTKDNSISFYVYFPNNLSGLDFMNNPKAIVNYLVRGEDGFEFSPNLDPDPEHHILPGDKEVIGDWSDNIAMRTPMNGPGYEMNNSTHGGITESSVTEEVIAHNEKSENDKGRNYLWGYGIDRKYLKQRLCGPNGDKKKGGNGTFRIFPENYVDNTDYGLNAEPNVYDEACAYSFLDVVKAISTDYNYSGIPGGENAGKIKEILGLDENKTRNAGGRKFYFSIAGGASVHGYNTSNDELSRNRGNFTKAWLEYCFEKLNLQVDYDMEAKIPVVTGIQGGENDLDVNSESAKRGRYAKAVIYWNDEDIKDASDAEKEYEEGDAVSGTTLIQDKRITDDPEQVVDPEAAAESTTLLNSATLQNFSSTRYRDEQEFFSLIKESDPVMFKNITDKVKYFDPVFHSITPEGFNSRLSFLHQCTRQGPTISSSDISQNNGINGAGYAGNLAFGRAPVCVLRLGDFYNTRIIINSLAIQYETAQWDMNPEGIGVQPMLANVTIGFVFQGGSSLGGPIQRLQNAVSFNYYANQEVYDDRADVAVYNGEGELSESSYVWIPGYGGTNLGSVAAFTDITSQIDAKNAYERQKEMGGPIDTAMDNMHISMNLKETGRQMRDRREAQDELEQLANE